MKRFRMQEKPIKQTRNYTQTHFFSRNKIAIKQKHIDDDDEEGNEKHINKKFLCDYKPYRRLLKLCLTS